MFPYQSEYTPRSVSDSFITSTCSLNDRFKIWLVHTRVFTMTKKKKHSQECCEMIIDYYSYGIRFWKISNKLKISISLIRKLKEHGITIDLSRKVSRLIYWKLICKPFTIRGEYRKEQQIVGKEMSMEKVNQTVGHILELLDRSLCSWERSRFYFGTKYYDLTRLTLNILVETVWDLFSERRALHTTPPPRKYRPHG